ncbi:MAG: hypothetical protein K9I94_08980 [Bacteroidales bacterium]|nr:hypothetical protein [Bacteroidales bacterium]
MKRVLLLFTVLLAAQLVYGQCDYSVTHDNQSLGTQWGGNFGDSPGDIAFTESGIPLVLQEFTDGNNYTAFDRAEIDTAGVVFGNGNSILLDNIAMNYEVSSASSSANKVRFEFADYGGFENFKVNNGDLYIGELTSAPTNIAPGVTFDVVTYSYGNWVYGIVTLTGEVQSVHIGGQEFWLDELCVSECDYSVTHEPLTAGTKWGNNYGNTPGDVAFNESGIPVILAEFTDGNNYNAFVRAEVGNAMDNMGHLQALNLDNISVDFAVGDVGATINQVTFEFSDYGGFENFQVNDGDLYIGELASAPTNIAPGVTYTVTTTSIPGGIRGEVTLTGEVNNIRLGGQEFWVDELCALEEASTAESQDVTVENGYNFVSSYIIPDNPDMTEVLSNILNENLQFVRDEDGNMLQKIGGEWVNGIGEWNTEEGYLIKIDGMSGSATITLEGQAMDKSTPLLMETGYNFASYLPQQPMDAEIAFESVINGIFVFARDEEGNMLHKVGGEWVNNIGDAVPGEFYLIKMSENGELIYP